MNETRLNESGGGRPVGGRAMPLIAAAVALAAGAAGLVTAIAARAELRRLRADLEDLRATVPAKAEEPARNLAAQINRVLDTVAKRINDTELRLNELARRLAELTTPPERPPAAAALPPAAAAPPAEAPSAAATAARTYTVAAGDTLGGIARKLGVSVSALQQANPDVNPARLKIGQKLNVP
ncbi:MAG: LysM peptidoglycan-binding domain-containing protein [Kiritimatiellae bacterium]|nr:LysM peptidoglycan-binding domain-containing protein [Kiritimatiellia bacterium]